MDSSQTEIFISRLTENFRDNEFVRLVFGSSRQPEKNLKNLVVRPVQLKSGPCLQFVYRYTTKDITKNFPETAAIENIRDAINHLFYNADLFTVKETIQFSVTGNGKTNLSTRKSDKPKIIEYQHDKVKNRAIETAGNQVLRELGILNASFEVRHEMSDKYLQICRYIEILRPQFDRLRIKGPMKIIDMGSGKGYLTFALYDFLSKQGIETIMTGIEQRKEMVDLSNEIAVKAGFTGLSFLNGTIGNVETESPHVLIALHACDTATDEAIFRGLRWGSELIIVAPCCHKQVRKTMKPAENLNPVMKHGILAERQAAIFTDTIRAMIMESYGYSTSVIEFIDSAHTPKNVMIIGRKSRGKFQEKEEIFGKTEKFMKIFGIQSHHLLTLLQEKNEFIIS